VRSGGRPRIIIDLEQQRAYFYKGGKIAGVSVVSTGREGYDTPSGEFRITQKDLTHVSSIYGDYVDRSGQIVMENVDITKDPRPPGTVFRGAPMPYFLRISGAVGMHAGNLPGYPASHGCIRLPKEMAVHFFQNAPISTPVLIRQESPQEYASDSLAGERYLPSTSIMER
jgi:lipoprotein-anchoring transpeptidase ErfK/SrfK